MSWGKTDDCLYSLEVTLVVNDLPWALVGLVFYLPLLSSDAARGTFAVIGP